MRYVVSFMILMFLLAGCAKKEENAISVPVVDPVAESAEIMLFNQSLPIQQEVLKKAYKKITPKVGLSHMSELKGTSYNGEFVFDESELPFIEYKFDKPYIIKKIHLARSGFVVNGKAEDSNIRKFEIVFYDAKDTPLYTSELKKGATTIDSFNNVQADGFLLKTRSVFSPKGVEINENDVIASFDGRVEVEVIDANYVYDIVAPVLSERDSSTSNEDLLKTIALLNSELFKRLREKRSDFNLPKTSVLYLPDDADMHYAVAHTQEIYLTGKYRTVKGNYKIHIFNEEAEFDDKGKIKVKEHKIDVQKSNRNLKTTTQLPEHEKFIDFSEGI